MIRHGSLFSGIGGFDLAASWHGWENVFQVEIDPFCNRILNKHFPDTKKYKDIKEFDATQYRDRIDVLTGGFPCQPFSSVGRRQGTGDIRFLWPEMLRVIREIRPRYILGENVAGFISVALEQVCLDLENEGYEIWPCLIPALAVGAAHYRDRVWIVAHATGGQCQGQLQQIIPSGLQETRRIRPQAMQVWDGPLPPSTDFCGVADGLPNRIHRIAGLGNAIVPQVAYHLFSIIEDHYYAPRPQISPETTTPQG